LFHPLERERLGESKEEDSEEDSTKKKEKDEENGNEITWLKRYTII